MSWGLRSPGIACLVAGCLSACTETSEKTCETADRVTLLQSRVQSDQMMRTGSSMSMALKKRVSVGLGGAFQHGRGSGKVFGSKSEYFGEISVGSPRQKFLVVYDTGSANLLIPGHECTGGGCAMHHQFDSTKSSTFNERNCNAMKPLGKDGHSHDQLSISFGTGKITGRCVQDQICVGDLCAHGSFVASTSESAFPFSTFKFDGILGLSRSDMAQDLSFSMMHRLVENNLLMQPVFSVFLSESDDEVSEVTFGEAKQEHMASELIWVPSNTQSGYWEVTIDDITFDNKKTRICVGCRVAVDTGTSQLAGPSDVILQLSQKFDAIVQSNRLKEKKSDMALYGACARKILPKLGFALANGKHVFNLDPEHYVSGIGCSMDLMSLDIPPPKGPLFIFGIPFLEKFFTVYDQANDKVGFAIAKHSGRTADVLSEVDTSDA